MFFPEANGSIPKAGNCHAELSPHKGFPYLFMELKVERCSCRNVDQKSRRRVKMTPRDVQCIAHSFSPLIPEMILPYDQG